MSRYSSRSLDVGSARYDSTSSSSYKSLDSSSMGSYRSSNLSGYGSHGYGGGRADSRTSSYSSSSSAATATSGLGSSSRLHHGSYSSRSSAVDSVPLPRSSSFGRSEVLSSSTPRDRVEKSSYSSSLGRSSSIPTHTEDTHRSSRYSGRSSVLSTNHSLDSGSDAAAERRLRLAERRRQREERGYSETSSDNSKEPSVERASSLRRDSDSDSAVSSARARRLAARLQEASVAEEPTSKDSSPDVADSSYRRSSRRLRGSSASSEDAAPSVPSSTESSSLTERRSSLRQRREQEAMESSESKVTSTQSIEAKDTDRLIQMSADARRARRQRRLEGLDAVSKQVSGSQEEEAEKTLSSSATAGSSRSWRQRLQEQGVSGVSASEPGDKTRVQKSPEDDLQKTKDSKTAGLSGQLDKGPEESSRQGSRQRLSEERAGDSGAVTDTTTTEGESRAERIARYKEERRKQLAHIASITSAPGTEEREGDTVPSLFTSSKREKEDSPSDGTGRPASAPSDSGDGVSLTSRLRARRRASQDSDSAGVTADAPKDTSGSRVDTAVEQDPVAGSGNQTSSVEVNSTAKRQTTPSSRSSPSPASTSQTSSTRKSALSDSSRGQKSSPARSPGPETPSFSSAGTAASGRRPSTGSREPSPRKTSVSSSDVRADRKQQESSTEIRKSKSPSPLTSRLMAPTKSSAAKGVQSHTPSTSMTSPRSSASPRGSPAPSDKQSLVRSASAASSTGPPKLRPSLFPDHGPKDASSSSTSVGKEGGVREASSEDQPSSRSVGRASGAMHTEARDVGGRQRVRTSPQKGEGPSAPKLSSSSFSTTSSTVSTDRDSGVGSSRLSSSSFSSTRSQDRDTASSKTAAAIKASRLQRTARVELSSSSSREGSEEKQLSSAPAEKFSSRTSAQTSLRRATSSPSKTALGEGHPARGTAAGTSTQHTVKSHGRDRKLSSSSAEKELGPPVSVSISQKARKGSVEDKAATDAGTGRLRQSTAASGSPKPAPVVSPGSPGSTVGLDDLLAKNAEFLSSDEETSGVSKKERRKLREGEEPKLRRSLRRKRSQKSGSESRSSSERDSKDKGKKEGMEVVAAATTPTLTLPTTAAASSSSSSSSAVVAEGGVLRVCPSPTQPPDQPQSSASASARPSSKFTDKASSAAASAPRAEGDSAKRDRKLEGERKDEGGKEEAGRGRRGSESKEATPDSDSVFHTASSAPSSVEMPRRRPQDKSGLRKSDLNKASSHPGAASQGASHDRGRRGDEEVSDIRSRFSGGLNNEKNGSSEKGSKCTAVARHPSRGKEFSQLLTKFSSSSEASSSERSDTEGPQRRRVQSFKRTVNKDVSSSSDDAQSHSSRNIPERTQSLKVARPSPRGDGGGEAEEKTVERSGSFKSDFMKKRFSPVPQSDTPSEELSQVLNRRHQEVERQQQGQKADTEVIADKQTAQAEQFKSSAIEEVIADSEVASMLRARRQKSETPEDSLSQPAGTTTQDLDNSSSQPGGTQQRTTAAKQTAGSGQSRKISLEEEASHKGHSHTTTKEPSPSSARSDSSLTSSFTLPMAAEDSTKAGVEDVAAKAAAAATTTPEPTESVTFTLPTQDQPVSSEQGHEGAETETHKLTLPTSSAHPADLESESSDASSLGTSASSLRRAESLKQSTGVTRSESFERRKGILKRTPSLPKQESRPVVDPQLHKIMEQRRQKELEMMKEKEEEEEEQEADVPRTTRPRALSAAEEIEENIRHMREGHQSKEGADAQPTEEEAALYRPVSDRIFAMETKLEEVKHTPVTPKSRSGASTPRSARSWSGSITPRKQMSLDEGVAEVIPEESTTTTTTTLTTTLTTTTTTTSTTAAAAAAAATAAATVEERGEEEVTGVQLMERLSTLAANNAQFQERRHKFQKRHREDWRTRTQPITLEEIHEADNLDTVSAFRAQVRRNASKSIFEQLKTQEQHRPLPTAGKGIEFPQHLAPEKRGRRSRHQRHKTLPVTAEELNAIPEGELVEPVPLRETHALWKRDSRTDSGILSGSEMESLGSDSLRSLSLEMDTSDSDPSRLSVSSKTSLFKTLDERARQEREKSASGAKRYIDRKKRERSRTQPVTDDEVQTASEMSAEEKKPPPPVKLPQPEVVNRPKSPSVADLEAEPEEDDQLTKLTLAEKVKLFSQKQKEEKEAAEAKAQPRTDAPVPKRRQRKFNSRFNTQPVTPEELEKASKISPLAMSLVKPPEPELLMGLKLKDQQELMMLHAEATLSQCSSRASSRPSSQPGSRRGSFTTPEALAAAASADQQQEKDDPVAVSEKATEKQTTTTTTTTKKQAVSSSHGELSRTDSEPRGILKKTKSTESVPSDPPSKVAPPSEPSTSTSTTTTTAAAAAVAAVTESSSSSASTAKDSQNDEEDEEGDRASPVAELILPSAAEVESTRSAAFYLLDGDLDGESSTDPTSSQAVPLPSEEAEEQGAKNEEGSRRRTRPTDRKGSAERYLTQPAPQLTPERSPQTKRKYEGRHMTQPITPDEMKEAEVSTTPMKASGGSIADRLNQLKTSGEENWKRKVVREKELSPPVLDVKLREKGNLTPVRPLSISDRLCKLEVSAKQWIERVEDTDAGQFTTANKLPKSVVGSESPLVAKIKASSKKDLTRLDDSSNASSPVNSPSTPTKEFLPKVPLPKEIIADPTVVAKKAETKEKQKTEEKDAGAGEKEEGEAVRVEVPTLDDEEIEQFFSTKEITEITDRVNLEIDDFDNIFIESNEILQSVKKIRPTRKKKATSRNPIKTQSQFVEIQTEYVQVSTGAAEKQLRKMKTEALKKDAGFALEALAGLASKENFSSVELRKTEPSSLPAALAARRNPFSDLMLLHIKGRRNIQTRLVEPSALSMNAGDCYILVTPDKVINWVGEFSNIIEKAKSADVANYIQQKKDLGYKGTAVVQTVEQTKDRLGAGKHFWSTLQGEKQCQACGPEEEDELYESSIVKTNMVYRLKDGALQPYEEYWGNIPKHSMLDKKEVLVFDFGSEFYVWQGKEVDPSQRKQGMALAQKLWERGYDYSECAINPIGPLRSEEDGGIPVQASERPDWAIFGKVNQNMETILFREKFADWPDSSRLIGVKREKSIDVKCDFSDIKAFDAKKMIPVNSSPVTLLLEGAHVGRGKKWQEDMQGFIKEQDILTLGTKVWHVLEYDHYQIPEPSYGHFHHGDTYVVRWQYMITNAGLKSLKGQAARHSLTGRERCAYFFWQGQDSTINEKGASALMTVELDEERGPQVRVVQGKEPPCFLNLFEGNMMVHIGKREDASTNTEGPWRLYCLRGDEEGEMCLLEIPVSITNLRSRSSLVLLNTRTGITYVWHGVKSPAHIRQLATRAVQNLKEKRPLELDLHKDAHIVISEVEEGEERAEIWSALDNKDRSLYNSLLTDSARYDYTPRLFYMTSVSMVFEVTEQMNPARLPDVTTPFPFFQSDLYKASQPALFLLDVGRCVYLWQGWWPVGDEEVENVQTGSATARYNVDRRCAMETTLNYCKERGSQGRTPEAFLVCAGVEPLAFQNLFPFWEVDSTVRNLAIQEGRRQGYCEGVEDVYIKLTQTRYTLEELQERPLPDGVDPLKLESYLRDEEFEKVLDMKREEFYALPSWKQNQLKQTLGLF